MPARITIGDAVIIALSDAEEAYPAKNVYFEATAEQLEPYHDLLTTGGEVLLNFGCYAVVADGRTVLVDTGWGPSHQGTLMEELAAAGIAVDSITTVTYTHLHGDHIGWNLVTENGRARPRFPKARYVAPRADWQHYAAQPAPSQLFREQMLPLADLGVLDLVEGEHTLSSSMTLIPTPGHTPGHTSLAITSSGAHGLVLGDVVISRIDIQSPAWKNGFDWDHDIARATRETVLARLEQQQAVVAVSHLPKPGLGRIGRSDGQRVWIPMMST